MYFYTYHELPILEFRLKTGEIYTLYLLQKNCLAEVAFKLQYLHSYKKGCCKWFVLIDVCSERHNQELVIYDLS